VRPTPEQLAPLTPLERATFEVADFLAAPRLTIFSKAWNSMFMGGLIYSCGGRRINVRGLEHLAPLGKKDSVLLVANHRSFFDFFSITAMVYWHTQLTKRIFFPVRQTFFYDHPAGPIVNAIMSGMRMFPPVMRDREKRAFNNYMVSRCIFELEREDIGTVLGLHPEGTRNQGDDPYSFLPSQIGVGRIALGTRRAKVIPVFALGMGQSIGGEMKMNLLEPAAHPVDIRFGAPIDFSDLRHRAHELDVQQQAADRCLEGIKVLAEIQRREAARRAGRDADAEPPVSARPPSIPPRRKAPVEPSAGA
jgi:1-acyl-sn-glycerol-3-phosphate acyltransferase